MNTYARRRLLLPFCRMRIENWGMRIRSKRAARMIFTVFAERQTVRPAAGRGRVRRRVRRRRVGHLRVTDCGQIPLCSYSRVTSARQSSPCPQPIPGGREDSMFRRTQATWGAMMLAQKSTTGNRSALR